MKLKYVYLVILVVFSCDNIQKEYDSEGNLKRVGKIVNGLKEGIWLSFYQNGDTASIETFILDTLVKKIEYSSDGPSIEESYKNGFKNGPFKVYWDNGQILTEGEYKNDSIHGEIVDYYRNGIIESVSNYDIGRPYGEYKYYYSDGTIQLEAQEFGEGEHHIYDSLGSREYTVIFESFIPVDTIN